MLQNMRMRDGTCISRASIHHYLLHLPLRSCLVLSSYSLLDPFSLLSRITLID